MISEKNENKRHCAKYIKNFVYLNKNKQYPLQNIRFDVL